MTFRYRWEEYERGGPYGHARCVNGECVGCNCWCHKNNRGTISRRVLDLFAGCDGWGEGIREWIRPIGIEKDPDACATLAAAGGRVIRGDVTKIDPARFRDVEGLIASPPCTDFSMSGLRAGITGETGKLMWEVPRWVNALRPRWVACEQVPPALLWWERFAHDFQKLGYMTWTGILNAADYGVPQTRQRAFLLASLDFQPYPPEPTHARNPHPVLFGEPKQKWVSMAEALGWTHTHTQEPAKVVCGHRVPRWCYPS